MRFLHTADWHLGRLFHQRHLTSDQAHVLLQIVEVAKDAHVDAVVVAGDVYDRGVPPPEAVELLDEVIARLLLDQRVPTIVAAGNHDSPERLAFASRVLSRQGLHLFGHPSASLEPVVLGDEHGEVAFYVAPYAEPAIVRHSLSDEAIVDHESAMRSLVASMLGRRPPRGRSVFVGHAFVQGASPSDSERPLSVGGLGAVAASCFDAFDFVALGHLHRPQDIGPRAAGVGAAPGPAIRYAGAILEYSFDEIGQERSVTIVEIDREGLARTEVVALSPLRELRRVEGTLDELLAEAARQPSDDYITASVLDRHPVLDPIGRLRAFYPNVMQIERRQFLAGADGQGVGDRRQLDHGRLFSAFFTEMTGSEPDQAEQAMFESVVSAIVGRDGEVRS